MKSVWKYAILIDDKYEVEMPKGAKVVHVGHQGLPEFVVFWVEVNPDMANETETRGFQVFGTGHRIDDSFEWVGTVTMLPGEVRDIHSPLVWHLYEYQI